METAKKILYLVRHAKSSWKDPSLADIERPLNQRGRRNAPDMGRRMRDQGHRPDLVISSPANRALTTARIIAGELGIDEAAIQVDEDLYFAGRKGMLDVLQDVDDRHASVMMVGHNPVMTDLVNSLTGTRIWNVPTCGIAIVGFDLDSWADVCDTDGELLGYDFPKGPGRFTDQ